MPRLRDSWVTRGREKSSSLPKRLTVCCCRDHGWFRFSELMSARHLLFRRCTALVLLLQLGLFSLVEMQIADIHDGHAERSTVSLPGLHAELSPVQDRHAVADHSATRRSNLEDSVPSADAIVSVSANGDDGTLPTGGTPHRTHVDHCAHSHSAQLAGSTSASAATSVHELVPRDSEQAPVDPGLATPFRPPVV